MNSREFMYSDPAVLNALRGIKRVEGGHNNSGISRLPDPMVVAMAYVPMQEYEEIYPLDEGFNAGTIFPELDKSFLGGKCK